MTPKTLAVDDQAFEPAPRVAIVKPGNPMHTPSRTMPPINPPAQVAAVAPQPAAPLVVLFPFGRSSLSPSARDAIDRELAGPGIRTLTIRARTDDLGPADVNAALAEARAAAVERHARQVLSARPGPAPRIVVDAQGACCYAAPNDSPEGRARNRRVELLVEREPDDL